VDVRFRVGYLLLSWGGDTARLSARYDRFENEDRDGTAEPDDETGSAWTVAGFWKPRSHVRLGVEYVGLHAQRPAAAFSGRDPNTNARKLTGELRLIF
jgi:phosphate-selective porin